MVFVMFRSENDPYRFCSFWSGIGYGFWGNYGLYNGIKGYNISRGREWLWRGKRRERGSEGKLKNGVYGGGGLGELIKGRGWQLTR